MPAPKKKQKKKGAAAKKKGGAQNKKNNNNKAGKQKKGNQSNKGNNGKQAKGKSKGNGKDEEKEERWMPSIRGIELIPLEQYKKCGQTFPPSLPVADLFDKRGYECNQTLPHPENGKIRMESDERKAQENEFAFQQKLKYLREGAEVHREVRNAAQHFIRPGMTMVEICEFIERSSSQLSGYRKEDPMARGWGFPTGCSLNHCAAHYTPNTGDKTKLRKGDLCKIDFGVQISGNIIDCAFSMSFDARHDALMAAVKAATNRGVAVMGVGARLGEIGGEIQEVMESFECEYDGKVFPVRCIRNLNGHSIGPWQIHAGKTVPIVKTADQTKMEEGELFAIETFGSTGKGVVHDDGECSHFALVAEGKEHHTRAVHALGHRGARDLYKFIGKRFGTIPFCRRWLDDDGQKRHLMSLKNLVDAEIVRAYPPLCDIPGCFTAQYEHTIYLKPTSKEVLSRGYDY